MSDNVSKGAHDFRWRTVIQLTTGASKGSPGDEKCVTQILGDKNKEVRGATKLKMC